MPCYRDATLEHSDEVETKYCAHGFRPEALFSFSLSVSDIVTLFSSSSSSRWDWLPVVGDEPAIIVGGHVQNLADIASCFQFL
jgi:hypothetical protein